MSIRLTLPYPPSANRYWMTFAYVSKNPKRAYGKPMANTVPSAEAKAYKAEVVRICKGRVECLSGDIELRIKVYRPMRRGDLDNRLKVLIDALRGIAYDDDDQIVKIVAERFDDKHNPRVELEIEEVY